MKKKENKILPINQEMKKHILEAITFLRQNNHTIPDEILEFMKKVSLKEIEKI